MNKVSKVAWIAALGVLGMGCPSPEGRDTGPSRVDTGVAIDTGTAIDTGVPGMDTGAGDTGTVVMADAGRDAFVPPDAVVACTATQYRNAMGVCTALTMCTATQYESAAATATSDRVCTALTTCTPTQYESTAATATSDRVCSDLAVCTATQYESTAATATSNRVCSDLAVCTATQYESTAATATSNRVCSDLTVCSMTQYQMVAPTPTTNRVCAPITVCSMTQYQTTAPTATTDRVCAALTDCAAGQFVMTAATATSNRVCAPCAMGTFSATTNAASCTAWAPACSATQYESTPATAMSNRVCAALTNCAAGQFVMTPPTATANRVCAACPASTFSTTTNAVICAAWTTCGAAAYQASAPSATANRVCTGCGAGRLDCDGLAANTCEDTRGNTRATCGCTGAVCSATQACVAGACVTVSRYTAVPQPAGVAFIDACAAAGAEVSVLAGTDDSQVLRPIPFAFNYYGTAIASGANINIVSNGWMGMDGVANNSLGGSIPAVGAPGSVIAPYWGDNQNRTAPRGQCIATIGTAPNRRWVVEWQNAGHCCGGDTQPVDTTYEVILTEGTNTIDFVYGTMAGARSQTVGIENAAGTLGTGGCPGGGSTCAPQSNTAVRFTPLYQNFTVPAALPAGCDPTTFTQVAATNEGGFYGYNTGDSNQCRAWKLAATLCSTAPVVYGTITAFNNWSCPASGGFTDAAFGAFCSVPNQYSCTDCYGACNAACAYNPLSLRNCAGSEAAQQ